MGARKKSGPENKAFRIDRIPLTFPRIGPRLFPFVLSGHPYRLLVAYPVSNINARTPGAAEKGGNGRNGREARPGASEKVCAFDFRAEKKAGPKKRNRRIPRRFGGVTFLTGLCHDLTEYFSILRRRARLLMPSFFAARLLLPWQSWRTVSMWRLTTLSREVSSCTCLVFCPLR